MFPMLIYRSTHEGYQSLITEELGFIQDYRRSIVKLRKFKNRHKRVHCNGLRRNRIQIMIDDRRHLRLVAIVNISRQNKGPSAQACISPHYTLDLTGLSSEHGANYNAETHRNIGVSAHHPQVNFV
jgi:hypothetical protein